MKKLLAIFLALLLLFPMTTLADGNDSKNPVQPSSSGDSLQSRKAQSTKMLKAVKKLKAGKDYSADEVLVQASSEQDAKRIAGLYGAKLKSYSSHGIAVLKLAGGRTVTQTLEKNVRSLASDPVLYPNYLNHAYDVNTLTPTDPDIGKQYCHTDMNNYKAWGITKGSRTVIVAVIDSGIDTDHPEFSGRISSQAYNSRDRKVGVAYVNDDQGHGSHVCGIIAAAQSNGKGGSGTAPGITLLPIKANEPNSPSFASSSIIEGIYYAADHGAKVLNMSLGRSYYAGGSTLEYRAIQYAVSKGVLIVCAAGNDAQPHAGFPAAYPECVAVSALASNSVFDYRYSNYGPEVDIAAPGTYIYSCVPDKTYGYKSGTSMASPQVAGVAALIKSAYPTLTASQLRQKLLNTAVDRGNAGLDVLYGYGAVNSYYALVQFTVSFNSQGGTAVAAVKAGYNGTLKAPASPTRASYHFAGWYKNAACTSAWNFSTDRVRGNMTLYAKWVSDTLKVTFNSQGGSAVAAKTVRYGTAMAAPANPARAGYTFGGWYREAACQRQWNFATDKVVDNITLYAKWTAITYTVTFNSQGGSAVAAKKAVRNALLQEPGQPLRSGYLFQGWFRESACYSPWTFSSDKVTGNMTLYAKWADVRFTQWNVTGLTKPMDTPSGIAVDKNGNVYVADTDNDRILKFSPSGALLAEWGNLGFEAAGYPAVPVGIALDSQSNIYITDRSVNRVLKYAPDGTFIRQWGSTGIGGGKFSSPNGVAVDSQDNVYVTDTDSVQKFTKDGSFLIRWQMYEYLPPPYGIPEGIAISGTDRILVSEAHFTHVFEFMTDGTGMGYYLRGGSGDGLLGTPAGLDVDKGGNLYITDNFYHRVQKFDSSYRFLAKWGTLGSGADQFSSPSDVAVDNSGNVYVADSGNNRIMVRKSPNVTKYRVTYSSMGGSAVPYMLVEAGKKLIAPITPVRSGYQFIGWYRESACTNAWNFSSGTVTGNLTLYAKWKVSPVVPAGVKGVPASYSSAKISWNASAGAAAYEVWREPYGASAFTLVSATTATSYTNVGLATGKKYYYRVRAYGMNGSTRVYSGWSAVVSVVPAPTAPASVKAVASSSSVIVSWGSVAGTTMYEVWRCTTSATGTYSLLKTVSGASYTNTGLTKGKTYWYKVRAYRLVGSTKVYSGFSAVVYAKP